MNTATTESMERLQRQLKRRDGEVFVLQVRLFFWICIQKPSKVD